MRTTGIQRRLDMPVRQFPSRPNLDQLRHQAKDLLRALRNGDPAAIDDFRAHHSPGFDLAGATLADAQLVLARSYQASSWPELVFVCEVLDATAHDDVEALRDLLARHPYLTRDAWKDPASGWIPVVAHAADLGLHRVIGMLQARGARGVSETRARPHLRKWLDMLRLLGQLGAQAPRDAVGGAVEILNGEDFAFMLEVGTDIEDWRPSVALALETYARNPDGKHRILDSIDRHGTTLPDTSPMAVHRGRLDLLARHLERDPGLLTRRFSHEEIYPPDLGCHADHALALHGAPLDGATLLHMAVDYEDLVVARWLLDRGRRSQPSRFDSQGTRFRARSVGSRVSRRDAARLGPPVPRPVLCLTRGDASPHRAGRPRMTASRSGDEVPVARCSTVTGRSLIGHTGNLRPITQSTVRDSSRE